MNFVAALNVLFQDKIVPKEIEFQQRQGHTTEWRGRLFYKSEFIYGYGNSKKETSENIYKQLYDLVKSDGVADSYQMSPSGYFQRPLKKKKKSTPNHIEKNTQKFINKHDDIVPRVCDNCTYEYNLPSFQQCKMCGQTISDDEQKVVYLDIERAKGDVKSDPIQIALVKFDLKTRRIIQEKVLNIKALQTICRYAAFHSHGMHYSGNYLVTRSGELLETISPDKAVEEFNKFISDSQRLLAHGDNAVDFTTLKSWFERYDFPDCEFQRIEKVNTSVAYKYFMQRDYNSARSGMKTIVEHYGSRSVIEYFGNGQHNALVDAKTLCLVSTSKRMYKRFASFNAFDMRFGPRNNYNVMLHP